MRQTQGAMAARPVAGRERTERSNIQQDALRGRLKRVRAIVKEFETASADLRVCVVTLDYGYADNQGVKGTKLSSDSGSGTVTNGTDIIPENEYVHVQHQQV